MSASWLAVAVLTLGLVGLAALLTVRMRRLAAWRRSLVTLRLRLPRGLTPEQLASGLGVLGQLTARRSGIAVDAVVFEVLADHDGITHRLRLPDPLLRPALAQLRVVWPGLRTEQLPVAHLPAVRLVSQIRLRNHSAPLASKRVESGVQAVLGALSRLQEGERIYLQWLLRGGRWLPVVNSTDRHGQASTADLRAKRAHLPLQLVGRVGVSGPEGLARARRRAVLAGLAHLNSNGARVSARTWPAWWRRHQVQQLAQPLGVWPVAVNALEGVGLLGLPVGELVVPGLPVPAARTVPPPPGMPKRGTLLGLSGENGQRRSVRLSLTDRLHHVHVLGPTGTGKSTLLGRMILQDAAAGHGVIVIDPKGGLAGDLLPRLPEHRHDDVVVLDPTNAHRPVGWNPLDLGDSTLARELAAEQLLHTLRSLWREFWGPRTDEIMRSVLLTLAMSRPVSGGERYTLLEAPELLTNTRFRRAVLENASGLPPHLMRFWQRYEAISEAERLHITGPVLNKLTAFTTRTPLRRVLGQSEGLRLPDLVRDRRIVLLRAEAGLLGGEVAYLLGALFLTSLWQAIQSRARLPWRERQPLFVYIDEVAQVVRLPVALPDVLAQARGLGIGLTLAHQHLQGQLSPDLRHGLLGTVRSRVLFQLGAEDARALAPTIAPGFRADDLQHLPAHEAVVALSIEGRTLPAFSLTTLDWPTMPSDGVALGKRLQQHSGERWGRALPDVTADIEARVGTTTGPAAIGRRPRVGDS